MSEFYISVDVETAGPSPDTHALLSIGAVAVNKMADTFYIELQPDRPATDPEAQAVHGLSLDRLLAEGTPPERAMQEFERWVLRVAGHTDNIPLSGTGRYADHWELSSARATSVVKFLIEQGVPANRLVAAGFGEFQPLDTADTPEARGKNRRIELKLTER